MEICLNPKCSVGLFSKVKHNFFRTLMCEVEPRGFRKKKSTFLLLPFPSFSESLEFHEQGDKDDLLPYEESKTVAIRNDDNIERHILLYNPNDFRIKLKVVCTLIDNELHTTPLEDIGVVLLDKR